MPINVGNYENQVELLTRTNTIINDLSKAGKTPRRQVYTSNGTWTAPQGVTRIFVTGGGGGGGGAIYNGTNPSAGSGGVTSFGNLLSLSGGFRGFGSNNASSANGGAAGGPGGQNGGVVYSYSGIFFLSTGGSAGPFKGGYGSISDVSLKTKDGGYCSGGGAYATGGAAGCGGSGDFVTQHPLEVIPGNSYAITIGQGGAGAINGAIYGGNGGNGILIIEWWE